MNTYARGLRPFIHILLVQHGDGLQPQNLTCTDGRCLKSIHARQGLQCEPYRSVAQHEHELLITELSAQSIRLDGQETCLA